MSIESLLYLVVYIVIIAAIFWAIMWFVGWVGVQEPWLKIIKIVVGLVALVIVVNILLGMFPAPGPLFHR